MVSLSDYEKRMLRHVAGLKVDPPVISGAALWQCLERLQGLGLVHRVLLSAVSQEWHLTERGKEVLDGWT
jgi:DNA-binding HxlR family transcriptional regulator